MCTGPHALKARARRTLEEPCRFFELSQAQREPPQGDMLTFWFSNRGKFLPGPSRAPSVSVVKKTQVRAEMDGNKSTPARWGWVFPHPLGAQCPPNEAKRGQAAVGGPPGEGRPCWRCWH